LKRDQAEQRTARFQYSADLRYRNQIHELVIPLGINGVCSELALEQLVIDFQQSYEHKYGHGASSPTTIIELLNLRLDVISPTGHVMTVSAQKMGGIYPSQALLGEKPIYCLESRRFKSAPIYQAEKLLPRNRVEGPALIVSYGTTIPLHAGQNLEVDAYQNYIITFES
jgi:N-methylhydantoinase A